MGSARSDQVDMVIRPLIGAMNTAAVFVSDDFTLLATNAAALSLLAQDEEADLLGQDCRSLFLVATDAKAPAQEDRLVHLDALCDGQRLCIARAPSTHFRASRVTDSAGGCLGYLLQALPMQLTDPSPEAPALQMPSHVARMADQDWIIPAPTAVIEAVPLAAPSGSPTEFSLAESEWRWKIAVLSANQGVWDHDFETGRHYVSQTWRRLRGLTETDSFPGSTEDWLETIHPGDLDHIKSELARLDSGETDIVNYKFRQRHAAGHWVWFLSSGRVVRRDRAGLPARIIGTDTDISDIKNVEMESQRMAQRLHIAMDTAEMGRWEYDIGAEHTYWDDRMLALLGIPGNSNHVHPRAWEDFIHPEDREAVSRVVRDRMQAREDLAFDYRIQRRDGTTGHVRTRGKYFMHTDGGGYYYGVSFDVTGDYEKAQELENARAKLEYESRHDALTGLANRRYLDDAFTRLVKQRAAENTRVAVLHFDIDHFKQINDTLGHDAGDATLKHAAGLLKRLLPPGTLVSRVGGDEFVALLADAPPKQEIALMARKIIEEMARPYFYAAQQCNIGTSIGIALASRKTLRDTSIFIDADLALYEAKKAGRGRSRFFDRSMKEEARRRKNSFDALLAGFDQGEITCHYQPQFDATTLEISGLEALVRWESAEYGLIMPDEFLRTAEDMGLLAQFDELVLQKALQDMEGWKAHGIDIPRVSVNVSSHRLNDPRLGDRFRGLNIPAGKLSFELLESAFLDAKNDTIEANLKLIEKMGIDVEIDDFGSGHASIVSLLQIAPKRLKIDRLLIKPIVESQRQRDLVETIIEIGHMLDVQVVAEGVETVEHVRILQDIGCGYLQGYALAHPMNAQQIRSFILGELPRTDDAGLHQPRRRA